MRLSLGLLVFSCASMLVACAETPRPLPFDEGKQAARADVFLESIGVNTHLNYTDTAYVEFDKVRRALQQLGVSRVREGLVKDRPEFIRKMQLLADDGIRFTVVVGEPDHGGPGDPAGSVEELHAIATKELLPSIDAFEGANEYDLDADRDPAWRENLIEHQRELHAVVANDPQTRDVPVIAPSLAREEATALVGDLSQYSDYANIHLYTGGVPLTQHHLRTAGAFARHVNDDGPTVLTETGYHNATQAATRDSDGHRATSEEAAAAYVPQQYLSAFAAGIERTFTYELLDERPDPGRVEPEFSFGLLRNDFSPKPAYLSLQEMVRLLAEERRRPFEPGKLDWTIDGEDDLTRSLLLQKSDGRFYLALWHEGRIWDPDQREPRPVLTRRVHLSFNQPMRDATLHVLGSDDPPRALETVTNVTVDVGPDVSFMELTPDL